MNDLVREGPHFPWERLPARPPLAALEGIDKPASLASQPGAPAGVLQPVSPARGLPRSEVETRQEECKMIACAPILLTRNGGRRRALLPPRAVPSRAAPGACNPPSPGTRRLFGGAAKVSYPGGPSPT